MITNHEFIEKQEDVYTRFSLAPFKGKKDKFRRQHVPFYDLDKLEESKQKFDRKKAWENAPVYNENEIINLI